LSGDGQNKLSILLEVDHLRVSDSDEAVVAVDLEGAEVVASQEGVDDPLPTAVRTNRTNLESKNVSFMQLGFIEADKLKSSSILIY
jgi:hypothetical protein